MPVEITSQSVESRMGEILFRTTEREAYGNCNEANAHAQRTSIHTVEGWHSSGSSWPRVPGRVVIFDGRPWRSAEPPVKSHPPGPQKQRNARQESHPDDRQSQAHRVERWCQAASWDELIAYATRVDAWEGDRGDDGGSRDDEG